MNTDDRLTLDESLVQEAWRSLHASALTAAKARQFARLASIKHTLDRLARGEWFTCEVCGGSIRRERLRLTPEVSVCSDCRTL